MHVASKCPEKVWHEGPNVHEELNFLPLVISGLQAIVR